MPELTIARTGIPGLLRIDLPVHEDNRGWFKENWQREKMVALGLPDFRPVQNNVSFNERAGTTRGIHAEPWDKLVSVAAGRVFGAWVDLREGPTFGRVVTAELGPETAMFVPQGVGNAFQTLADATAYSYLVNEHWSAEARDSYSFVNLADPRLDIAWPIPLEQAECSEADRTHPDLAGVTPVPAKRLLVLGGGGQLGRALQRACPEADVVSRDELDLTDAAALEKVSWWRYDAVVNAAAYTAVDDAETPEGRRAAWAVNTSALGTLARIATRHRLRLVHISSDYVFDGTAEVHPEDEPLSPLGVYGQTKAAGDALVAGHDQHYVVRTSWVVGDGPNFVRTMARLADRGASPSVVDDQHGRLTFADDLAGGVLHLLRTHAPFGTYNLTSSGPVRTWADIAEAIFAARGRNPGDVSRVSTEEYAAGAATAPRPRHSTLDLAKIEAAGYSPQDGDSALLAYVRSLPAPTD